MMQLVGDMLAFCAIGRWTLPLYAHAVVTRPVRGMDR
jgi:hypothetical protein